MTRAHPHLLEIAAWPWLERLSRAAGRRLTLAEVPGETWDLLARQGFDTIYLMGIWERSRFGRELALSDRDLQAEYDRALPGWTAADVAGSPYCVPAYVPDRRMGGWAGLDAARAAVHTRGMNLVVDFVTNHTAFDHPWVLVHPERYVLGGERDLHEAPGDFRRVGEAIVACGRDPFFAPWRDVAQLNYFNPETRAAMSGVLREIAAHADGVRCDMAMLVLNDVFERTWRRLLGERWPTPLDDFWPSAIAGTPSLTYLAEVYWDLEWQLQQQGFHFTYDKRLLDRLHSGSAAAVREHLRADAPFRDRLARFLENHDEPRSARQFARALPAAATTLATLPGLRFFFDGQMEGARTRVPVQLGRWPVEEPSAAAQTMYARILETTDAPLFHEGSWRLCVSEAAGDGTHLDLIAWEWRLGEQLAVVAINLSSGAAHAHVRLEGLPGGLAWDFEDRLTGVRYRRTRDALVDRGLYVRLESGSAHLFVAAAAV